MRRAALITIMCLVAAACSGGDGSGTTPALVESTSTEPPITALPPVTTTSSTTTSTTTTTTTTTQPPRVWDGMDRINIALLGSDAGVGRTGTRTDTVILVSIDPESGDAAMFSVPRNLTEAPLPEDMGVWSCNCFPDIITHLWANAEWFPDAFPGPQEPPVNAIKAALGGVFGVDIHYYAKVELAQFVGLFDALGGVAIDVPSRVVDSTYPHEDGGTERVVIEEGPQLLDGHLALAYGRIRRNSGDFARMHRQRCVLGAALESVDPGALAADYGWLETAIVEFVETDIPLEHLDDFVELLSLVELDRFATVRITRYNYGTTGHAGYQIYDLPQIRADLQTLIDDPKVLLDSMDGDGWDEICSKSFD